MTGVGATAWLTLAARALADDGFVDAPARALASAIPPDMLVQASDAGFMRGVAVRSAWFDLMARAFFTAHPDGAALTLGAGLCTRRRRLAATLPAGARWTNVDVAEVIAWRECLLPAASGEVDVVGALHDASWQDALAQTPSSPLIVFLEGVCPYVPQSALEACLRELVDQLMRRGQPARLVLDFVHPALGDGQRRVGSVALPVVSGYAGIDQVLALHPALRRIDTVTPYATFSPGHDRADRTFRAAGHDAPYTLACLALETP